MRAKFRASVLLALPRRPSPSPEPRPRKLPRTPNQVPSPTFAAAATRAVDTFRSFLAKRASFPPTPRKPSTCPCAKPCSQSFPSERSGSRSQRKRARWPSISAVVRLSSPCKRTDDRYPHDIESCSVYADRVSVASTSPRAASDPRAESPTHKALRPLTMTGDGDADAGLEQAGLSQSWHSPSCASIRDESASFADDDGADRPEISAPSSITASLDGTEDSLRLDDTELYTAITPSCLPAEPAVSLEANGDAESGYSGSPRATLGAGRQVQFAPEEAPRSQSILAPVPSMPPSITPNFARQLSRTRRESSGQV